MSDVLLQRLKQHVVDDGGFLSSYDIRYYRWSDADLNGNGNVALFRMAGTSGIINHEVQFNDVSLYLLCNPASVRAGDADMLSVLRYLRANYSDSGNDIFNAFPVGSYNGPNYLENDRGMFEMVIRCGTVDH